MSRICHWQLVGTTIVLGIIPMTEGLLQAFETKNDRRAQDFIRVGQYRINVGCINYARDDQDTLVLTFSNREELRFTGKEADKVRGWLDERCVNLMKPAPKKGRVIMEGVDTAKQPGGPVTWPAPLPSPLENNLRQQP